MFDQKAYNKQYYLDNAEALKAKARERQRAKPRVRPLLTPEQRVERARVVSRINIGVHPDHVTGEAKSGPCEICKTDTSLHFDHDHRTGFFRGWLCSNCNKGLGMFRDSPHLLLAAFGYLTPGG